MGVLSNNRAQIVAGGLISASFVSDLYDVFTGAISESIVISGSSIVTGSVKISGSLNVNFGITGSLLGSASWSSNSITASYVNLVAGPNIIINTVGTSYEITGSPYTYLADSASFSSSIASNYQKFLFDSASFSSSIVTNLNNYLADSASFSSSIAAHQNYITTTPLSFTGSFTGSLSGSLFGTSSYALTSVNVLVIGGDTTNANRVVLFADNVGENPIKSDSGFEYNPNTNTLSVPNISATSVVGNLTGNVTGNIVGTTAVFTSITGSIQGTTSGIHTGSVQGDVSGSITGSYAILTNITASNISSSNNITSIYITGSNLLINNNSNITSLTASYANISSLTASLYGTSSVSVTSSYAITASYYQIPVARFSDTNNGFSLANSVDNTIRFDTTDFNMSTAIFELLDSNQSTAVIYIKQPGYYEFISQIYISGLGSDVDVLVKLLELSPSGSTSGATGQVTLFNDFKSIEGTNDQTISGTYVHYVTNPTYYRVVVNPSNGATSLITTYNTPSRITIKKLG